MSTIHATSCADAAQDDGHGVKPPAGTEADSWQHDEFGDYRIVYRTSRIVGGRPDIRVQPTAIQLGDGSIDNGDVIEGPVVHVDGVSGDPLTVDQSRRLSAAILAAANELDRINGRPLFGLCDDCGAEHWRGECQPLSSVE